MAMAEGGTKEAITVGEAGDESTITNELFPANFTEIVASLPQGPRSPIFGTLLHYRGFWFPDFVLQFLPNAHAAFDKRPADILLASFPKTGTTWLKALAFATARRSVHSPSDGAHPLLSSNPHNCVKFIDTPRFLQDDGGGGDTAAPRLLATHLPYSLLPRRATADVSDCRIVYITRDPKDTLVSLWHFEARVQLEEEEAHAQQEGTRTTQQPASTAAAGPKFEETFELFCRGEVGLGPQWEHAREYWEASKRRPGHVLCLRYEEMLQDPVGNLKKMAEFMGCPFSAAEEEAGVVRAILELCSMEKQRSVAVNKTGDYVRNGLVTVKNKHFFRKGVAGDWRNYMTPEMASRLDGVVEEALEGSGSTFGNTTM